MGVLPLYADLFCFTRFHFRLYMLFEQTVPGSVGDPVDIAQVVQMNGVGSNPTVHILSTCYGMVNLNLFHPTPPPPLRVFGRWVGGSESGWVGQPKSREGQLTPPPQYR